MMHDFAKMLIHYMNNWTLETISARKHVGASEDDMSAYKLNYTRWLCFCRVPIFCDNFAKYYLSQVFGKGFFQMLLPSLGKELLEKFSADKEKLPVEKGRIFITHFPRFLKELEEEVLDDNSLIWNELVESKESGSESGTDSPTACYPNATSESGLLTGPAFHSQDVNNKRPLDSATPKTENEKLKLAADDILYNNAYHRALDAGKRNNTRIPIMIVGQDRAGKTSLKKYLLGMPFDIQEPSTNGIDVDVVELTDRNAEDPWKRKEVKQFMMSEKETKKQVFKQAAGFSLEVPKEPNTSNQAQDVNTPVTEALLSRAEIDDIKSLETDPSDDFPPI